MARRKQRTPPFDRERAVVILGATALFGDQATAKRFRCSTRTIERYRARLKSDDALAADVVLEKQRVVGSVRDDMVATLLAAHARIRELLPVEKDLHTAVGAAKIVGELLVAADALGVGDAPRVSAGGVGGEQPAPPRPGGPPPAPARAPAAGGDEAPLH